MDVAREVVSLRYKPAVVFAVATQASVGLLALMLLDSGRVAHVVGVAGLGFWLATAVLVARRPHTPTGLDLAWVRWGFWPALVAAAWVGLRA